MPSTLLEEMKRDRRWCQGNLQHLRLLFTEGLFGAHRALFLNGVLSYVSALAVVLLPRAQHGEAIAERAPRARLLPARPSLFPEWPVWRPDWALWLLAVTGVILFLPKMLSVAAASLLRGAERARVRRRRSASLASVAARDRASSSLLAPIRMVFHTRFVV